MSYTATLTLSNAATVTKTFTAITDLPAARQTVAQYCKNGGMFDDTGVFHPTPAIFSVAIAVTP